MSEMSDFFKRMAENGKLADGAASSPDTSNSTDDVTFVPGTPIEQAVEKAIYALKEIKYYAELGRAGGCLTEATEALDLIEILMDQHRGIVKDEEVVEANTNE